MTFPLVLAVVILVFVGYAVMAYVTKFIARILCVGEYIIFSWMKGEKLTDDGIVDAWDWFEKAKDTDVMATLVTVLWPLGLVIMVVSIVIGIPVAVYYKIKRVMSVPSFSFRLRPKWWHVSNLTRIINKFL